MDNKTRRILIITKLKGLGFNDSKLFSKVMIGRGNTLKAIINKYIKGKNLDILYHIRTLLELKQFRNESYMCSKCQTWHYLGSKIFEIHSKHSNLIHHATFQKECIDKTLNGILSKQYRNNKNNKEFQDLIESINQICKADILPSINNTLRIHIIAKYQTFKETTYNVKINEFNLKCQINIRKIKEMIDLIDYHNFLTNEIRSPMRSYQMNDRTYTYKSKYTQLKLNNDYGNINNALITYRTALMNYINTDKFMHEIFDKLDINDGKIINTKLYNKLNQIWIDHKNSILELRYGIKYSDKNERHNKYISENNLFYDRDSNSQDLMKLNDDSYNIFFCYENSKIFNNYKFWLNYILKNDHISFIDKGIDALKRKHRKPSNFILYKYEITAKQLKALRNLSYKVFDKLNKEKPFEQYTLMQLIQYCNQKHIYLKPFIKKHDIIKSVNLFNKPIHEIYTHRLKVEFTYTNQQNKLRNYQKFIKSLGLNEQISYTKLFLLNTQRKNNLFTYLANKRNVIMTNLDRLQFDKDLGQVIYYISFINDLTKEIRVGNKTITLNTFETIKNDRKYLHKILTYALSNDMIKDRFISFLNNKINEINHKVVIRQKRYNLITDLISQMKAKYDRMNKRTNKAKLYKKEIDALSSNTYISLLLQLNSINAQKKPFERFINRLQRHDKFNVSILNKTVYNIFKSGITEYMDKKKTRIMTTKRSKLECIKYALKLMNYDSMIEIVDSELNKPNEKCQNNEIDYTNKFDEILDNYTQDSKLMMQYSSENKIPIKSLLVVIMRLLPYLDNKVLMNYLLHKIYKMLRTYQTFENKILA